MKIINAIVLAIALATGVNGQAEWGDCDDYGITTKAECGAECRSRGGRGGSRWRVQYDADKNLIECDCTYKTGNDPEVNGLPAEGIFTCTRTIETPIENTTEKCPKSIKSWDECKKHCTNLAGNWGWSASHRSSNGVLTRCSCDYGPDRQNNYTCTRSRESYLRSN